MTTLIGFIRDKKLGNKVPNHTRITWLKLVRSAVKSMEEIVVI